MAVFVGTAAADGKASIVSSHTDYKIHDYNSIFDTTDNVYACGFLGHESGPNAGLCGQAGCGGRIYIVNHRDTWPNGTLLEDVSGGYETVTWFGGYDDGCFGYDDILAWPADLTPGRYQLILDLNCTGHNGFYTNISDPRSGMTGYIKDRVWNFTVTEPTTPIPEFSTIAIPVAGMLGLLFFYNYRKRRREE